MKISFVSPLGSIEFKNIFCIKRYTTTQLKEYRLEEQRARGSNPGSITNIFSINLNEEMNQEQNKNKSKKSRSLAISCRQKRYHITF